MPLSKKLAELLGGSVTVKSEVGVGSTFSVKIPPIYKEPVPEIQRLVPSIDSTKWPVLVIENDPRTILTYEKYLKRSDFQVIPAYNLTQAKELLKSIRPSAIILDILLPGEDGWAFLAEMKATVSTQAIPILVVTIVEDEQKGMALGAYDYCVKPVEGKWLLKKSAATRIAGGLMKGPRGTLSGVAPTNKITTNQSQITNDQFVICEWLFVIC